MCYVLLRWQIFHTLHFTSLNDSGSKFTLGWAFFSAITRISYMQMYCKIQCGYRPCISVPECWTTHLGHLAMHVGSCTIKHQNIKWTPLTATGPREERSTQTMSHTSRTEMRHQDCFKCSLQNNNKNSYVGVMSVHLTVTLYIST